MTARVYNSLHSAGFMVISRFILVLQHNQFSFFNITKPPMIDSGPHLDCFEFRV